MTAPTAILDVLLAGQPASLILSPGQTVDLVRDLLANMPAEPALLLLGPIQPNPGESSTLAYTVAPCAAAVHFRIEVEIGGVWVALCEDEANPGAPVGGTLYLTPETTYAQARAVAVGATGYERAGLTVTAAVAPRQLTAPVVYNDSQNGDGSFAMHAEYGDTGSQAECIGLLVEDEGGAEILRYWSADRSGTRYFHAPTGHGRARTFECASDGAGNGGAVSDWVTF